MYRNKDLRAKQFFVQTNWPGGIYASPTIAGQSSNCFYTLNYFNSDFDFKAFNKCQYMEKFILKYKLFNCYKSKLIDFYW